MKIAPLIFLVIPCICSGVEPLHISDIRIYASVSKNAISTDSSDLPNYPKVSPTATTVYELQSNKERTHFYVDGKELPSGRRVKIIIDDNPHTVVAKPEKCISKEEYIQPPYNSNAPLSFTFLMDECNDSLKIIATNSGEIPATAVRTLTRNKEAGPTDGYSEKAINYVPTKLDTTTLDDSIMVLIEGYDDGVRTNSVKDRDEATLDAKRQAIERAGVRISSNLTSNKSSTTENGKEKYSNQQAAAFIESQSDGVLLPGYQILDKGYQSDGTYLVILSGKVKVISK